MGRPKGETKTVSVRISEEAYEMHKALADDLSKKLGKRVTVSGAMIRSAHFLDAAVKRGNWLAPWEWADLLWTEQARNIARAVDLVLRQLKHGLKSFEVSPTEQVIRMEIEGIAEGENAWKINVPRVIVPLGEKEKVV